MRGLLLKKTWRRLVLFCLLVMAVGTIPALAADAPLDQPNLPPASPLAVDDANMTVSSPAGNNFTFVGVIHTIVVNDKDENTIPGPGNDTITVTLRVVGNPASEITVTLFEDGAVPGRFIGTVNNSTVIGGLVPNVAIRFRYVDVLNSSGIPRAVDKIFNVIATTANVYTDPTSGLPGEDFIAVVEDPDQDLNAGPSNDSVTVYLCNFTAGCPLPKPYLLQETPIEGTFAGLINNVDPNLDVVPVVGQQIQVLYNDINSFGNPVAATALYTLVGTAGAMTVTPDPVAANGALTITVTDLDGNINAGGANDTLQVEVHHLAFGEVIVVTLDETDTEGVFSGIFELNTFANPRAAGDQILVRYIEPVSGGTNLVDVTVTVASGVDGVLIIPDNLAITQPMPITVIDPDINFTPESGAPDTLGVNAELCPAGGGPCIPYPGNPVVLTETGPGEFSGEIPDILAAWPTVAAGDTIKVTYQDLTNSAGLTVDVVDSTLLIDAGDAVLTVEPTLIAPGDEITITVIDLDQSFHSGGENDSVTVTIQDITLNSPIVTLTLPETTQEGVFQLTIPTSAGGAEPEVGDIIRVTYVDYLPAGGGAPVTHVVDVTVTAFGTDATIVAEDTIPGRPVHVIVTDADRGASQVKVTAINITTNTVLEEFTLPRVTGTSRFEGSVITAYGTQDDGVADGVINVKGGDVVRVFYHDSLNTAGDLTRVIHDDANVISRSSFAPFCDRGTAINNPTWQAEYFNNTTLQGTPLVVAEETEMHIFWEETAPFREIPADKWSARWTTTLNFTENGKFRFQVGADDGVRFYIDNALVIDQFKDQQFTTFTADKSMFPGQHTFKVEYYDGAYDAGLTVDCTFLENPVSVINAEGNPDLVYPSDTRFDQAVAHITTGRINVRANPGVTAAWIGYVYIYQRYPILGITQDGQWVLIQLNDGRSGWISSQFVKRYEDTPVQIFPNWSGSETSLPNVEVSGYATAELKIRIGPRDGEQIGLLPPNEGFRVLSRTQSGAWYKIEWNGIVGWVYAPYVVLTNGTVQDLPRE